MSNEAEIAKLVGIMAAGYPHTEVSDATIEVYVAMLKDIPLEILEPSIQQCMAESDFFPTVAKVRERALSLTKPISPEPLEAWGIVLQAIGKYGIYSVPKFDDPIIAKAVECIGWNNLCNCQLDNQAADRAHFSRLYEGLQRQAENDRRLLPQARQIQQGIQRMITGRTMPDLPKDHAA